MMRGFFMGICVFLMILKWRVGRRLGLMDNAVVWFGSLAVARSTLAVTTERSSNALTGRFAAGSFVPSLEATFTFIDLTSSQLRSRQATIENAST